MKVRVSRIEDLRVGDVFPSGMRVDETTRLCAALESDEFEYNITQPELDVFGGVEVERDAPQSDWVLPTLPDSVRCAVYLVREGRCIENSAHALAYFVAGLYSI